MIFSILFLLLILVGLSALLFFLFEFFLPSLNAQQVNAEDPLYAKEELDAVMNKTEFKRAKTGLIAQIKSDSSEPLPEKDLKKSNDCSLYVMINGSGTGRCVGIGNCSRVCPRKAISITKKGAVVYSDCNGCGLCVASCPLNLISLVPVEENLSNCQNVSKKDFQFFQKCYRMFFKEKKAENR